jgi:hypothetical protein
MNWCIIKHKWEYLKRTHYKYRGPVKEYFKRCQRCGKAVEIHPWYDQTYRLNRISKEVRSISSY